MNRKAVANELITIAKTLLAKENLFKDDKNWLFPKGTKVKVDLSSGGLDAGDMDMSEKEFEKFMKHDGQTAKVTNLEVETEDDPKSEFNYYRVKFSDGYNIQISAQMLEKQ